MAIAHHKTCFVLWCVIVACPKDLWHSIKKFLDIIPKEVPKVHLPLWQRSHWPGSKEANFNLLMIFRREWTKLKYTLNLARWFLLHSTNFQYFFMDSKVNCQVHMITNMFKNIWKECFIKECFWSERNILCVILLFSSPRCAIITCLNLIYTKFRHAMIAQLNKIWHVWVCVHAIARHSQLGLEYVKISLVFKKFTNFMGK